MAETIERELGQLETRLAALEKGVSLLVSDVRQIRDALHSVKGGWKALGLVIAASSAVGGIAATLWTFVHGR